MQRRARVKWNVVAVYLAVALIWCVFSNIMLSMDMKSIDTMVKNGVPYEKAVELVEKSNR